MFKIINPCKKIQIFFSIIKSVAKQPKRKHISKPKENIRFGDMFSFWLLSNAFYNWKNICIFLQGFIILNNFFCIVFFWCCGGVDKTRFSIYLLCERGFAIYSIIFSLISLLLKSILCSFQFDWCYSLFIGFMMILALKYTLIVFRSN